MKPADYPASLKSLIAELKRMPGVGPRSAERMALWMLQSKNARPVEIARAIDEAAARVRPCEKCAFFSIGLLCDICADPARDATLLCVVEQPTDILPLERTGAFRGLYHALQGKISPLDHVGPDDLRIASLLERIEKEPPVEIILALGSDVEGEATASYIASTLRGCPAKISRIAQGLPAGGGLEYADDLTISRALVGRRTM